MCPFLLSFFFIWKVAFDNLLTFVVRRSRIVPQLPLLAARREIVFFWLTFILFFDLLVIIQSRFSKSLPISRFFFSFQYVNVLFFV